MARKKKDDAPKPSGAAQPGNNGYGELCTKFVARIEDRLWALESERSEHMLKCKDIRADISEIYGEAADAGIPKRALKSVIKVRALEEKQDKVRADLEPEDMETHDQIRHALGDLADLPLGQAVLHPDTSNRPFGVPPQ